MSIISLIDALRMQKKFYIAASEYPLPCVLCAMKKRRLASGRRRDFMLAEIDPPIPASTFAGIAPAVTNDIALFGSLEWWNAVRDGRIPTHTTSGVITKVTENVRGTWPLCEINSGGVKTEWTRYGEDDAYQVGRRICIEYVYQRGKPSKVWKGSSGRMKVVLRVSIALRAEFDAIPGGPRFVAAEARTKPGPPDATRTKPGPPDAARTKPGPPDAARTKPGPPAPRTLLEKKCAASPQLSGASIFPASKMPLETHVCHSLAARKREAQAKR